MMGQDHDIMLPRKAKGKRPFYFSDPDVDRLLSMIMALTGELSVTRDRLDTLERVAGGKGLFSGDDIEGYELSNADMEARAARHQTLFQEVTRIIVGELEDLESADDENYHAIVDQVENDS
ncbi:MAG: hypothetical protein L7S55_06675 [Luminiphilus sp.]|nr:hypothetical protein [Luminiphilus sp.]